MTSIVPSYQENTSGSELIKCYLAAKHPSIKHSSYFQVYEEILGKYRNLPITFVEIGILDGGSLFMWRKFFGDAARIIGIDLNPSAAQWRANGFEIFIGSQEDPKFWDEFFKLVGDVDVILDDGGHSNSQQIVTTHSALPHIRDGGLLIIEDVHTSYLRDFGNPSRYSFINYSKKAVDRINLRSSLLNESNDNQDQFKRSVFSCSFYESIVCFHIDRRKCFVSTPTVNTSVLPKSHDFRYEKYRPRVHENEKLISVLRIIYVLFLRFLSLIIFQKSKILLEKLSSWKMRKYFR